MEFVGHDGRKVLWEVADINFTEDPNDHYEIGIRGFDLNIFDEDEKGVGIEGYSEFPYLLMLIKLWIYGQCPFRR